MKLLLVTMYFPPAGGGGVQRPLKFATHLPAHGIETHVLAPDDPKWLHSDPELAPPTQAWIHRARYVGPRARKLADDLHGRQGLDRLSRQARSLSRRVLVPDENVGWNLTAIPAAVRIARTLPLNVAMRMAIMGRQERLSAARMYELGLLTEVVAPDALPGRLKELAEMVNRNAPLAVRGTRLAIRKGLGIPLYEAELLAEAYRERVLHTEDSKEGPRAFMEKREPRWRGR